MLTSRTADWARPICSAASRPRWRAAGPRRPETASQQSSAIPFVRYREPSVEETNHRPAGLAVRTDRRHFRDSNRVEAPMRLAFDGISVELPSSRFRFDRYHSAPGLPELMFADEVKASAGTMFSQATIANLVSLWVDDRPQLRIMRCR